ncbi:ribosomal protein l34-like protein [Baffinella frigidus]|nr:ribosomal protein l34-like protein [Cryptophyta sp. CCMP2293]|mmetsp:Transcript_27905/g.63856  ORF Transcript_27905/g.63856 Transcript_27905/m.63856 type:complete len:122 (+) Transcript_27905:50-415(+)
MKDTRLAFRRRHSYNTKSNKTRVVKTPGGKLALLYVKKQANVSKCGDCGEKLRGVKALRPMQKKKSISTKRLKHVSRAYGGARCGKCVRQRIIRAFLIEEQKIVKRVLIDQQKAKPTPAGK